MAQENTSKTSIQKKASIIANDLDELLLNNKPVDEIYLVRLFTIISEAIVNDKEIEEELDLLKHDIQALTFYENGYERDGFYLGACWAALDVLQACEEKKLVKRKQTK